MLEKYNKNCEKGYSSKEYITNCLIYKDAIYRSTYTRLVVRIGSYPHYY